MTVRYVIFCALLFIAVEVSAATIMKEGTFYSDSFEGGTTANGEIFHQDGFTAAACDIPLGKNVYVSSESTGVVLHINDRPNCNRYPNVLDLTRGAFSLFAPETTGRIPSLSVNTLDTFREDRFSSLGILLNRALPSVYFAGESIGFEGHVTDKKSHVILFLQNQETKEEISRLFDVDTTGVFHATFTLPKNPGKYIFVLASGNSFQTQDVAEITLIDREKLITPPLPKNRMKVIPRMDQSGSPTIILSDENAFWGNMHIEQDRKKYDISGSRFVFDTPLLFQKGSASIKIDGYRLGLGGPLDRQESLPNLFSGSVILDRIHERVMQKGMTLRNNKTTTTVKFRVPSSPKIRGTYYLTLPDGDVREFDFTKQDVGSDSFLLSGKTISLSVPTSENGSYMLETVQEDGIAYFNFPIVRGQVWNILKPYSDESAHIVAKDQNTVESYIVNHINKLRAALGRGLLVIDPEFTRLAQTKAEDMVRRHYYGHRDPDGHYIGSLADKLGIDMHGEFRENIAYGQGDIGHVVLQDGLEESGSHRYAMIVPNYTKIGIGYVRDGNTTYIVHILGE